jgi:hypothetical protein
MGCLRRFGCLLSVVLLLVVAWLTHDRWLHYIPGASRVVSTTPTVSNEPLWEPLSPAAAASGKRAIDGLASRTGPVFANLRAAEIASYVFQSAGAALPAQTDSAEAAVIGDVLYVRAIVPMKAIAASGALGPLGGLLNDRERISLGGSFHVVRPGVSEFQLRDIKLRDFSVPHAAIPRLVRQISRGTRPAGIADDAIPVTTPRTLADVRIANRRVTLYKTTGGDTP